MKILAIDTATKQAGITLTDGETVRGEIAWFTGSNHSRHLARLLPELLTITETSIKEVEGVVVAAGPGSFNGLRVGISAAKGLALALHCPLAGIGTLDVIGLQASRTATTVWAVLSAGRGEVYLGVYQGQGDTWRRVGEYRRLPAATVADDYDGTVLLAGEGAQLVANGVEARGGRPWLVEATDTIRRSAYLAELGRRYFAAQGVDQIDALEPLYLRHSAAEENRDARNRE